MRKQKNIVIAKLDPYDTKSATLPISFKMVSAGKYVCTCCGKISIERVLLPKSHIEWRPSYEDDGKRRAVVSPNGYIQARSSLTDTIRDTHRAIGTFIALWFEAIRDRRDREALASKVEQEIRRQKLALTRLVQWHACVDLSIAQNIAESFFESGVRVTDSASLEKWSIPTGSEVRQ